MQDDDFGVEFFVIGQWIEWVCLVAREISLPGGKVEKGDKDDGDTATRETNEEMGLHPSLMEVITVVQPFL